MGMPLSISVQATPSMQGRLMLEPGYEERVETVVLPTISDH